MSTATTIQHHSTAAGGFSTDTISVAETWGRMEKKAFPENSSSSSSSTPQPEFLPLGRDNKDEDLDRRTTPRSLKDLEDSRAQQLEANSLGEVRRFLTGESTATCTPWRTRDYSCDPAGLHEEIMDFYEYMKPRPSEYYMRFDVIARVSQVIVNRWPHARVEVFGSCYHSGEVAGMFLPTSDIDFVVFGQWSKLPLFTFEEEFKKAGIAVEDSLTVIDKTAVPIIKFIDRWTEVHVDISFNQETGLLSAAVINDVVQQFPILPQLMLLIKQFLVQRNLNEVYHGGISSYSLTLLAVSFLQLHPRRAATDASANLGVLLIEFFELYGRQFNYMKAAIDVRNGGTYIPKPSNDSAMLYIVDPTNPEENASRGCYGMYQVKQAFEYAFLRLSKLVITRDTPILRTQSLLSSVIEVSTEVVAYRNWVDATWQPSTPPSQYYYPPTTAMFPYPPPQFIPPPYSIVSPGGGGEPLPVNHVIVPPQSQSVSAASSNPTPSSTSTTVYSVSSLSNNAAAS